MQPSYFLRGSTKTTTAYSIGCGSDLWVSDKGMEVTFINFYILDMGVWLKRVNIIHVFRQINVQLKKKKDTTTCNNIKRDIDFFTLLKKESLWHVSKYNYFEQGFL